MASYRTLLALLDEHLPTIIANFRAVPATIPDAVAKLQTLHDDIETQRVAQPEKAVVLLFHGWPQTAFVWPKEIADVVRLNPDEHPTLPTTIDALQLVKNTLIQLAPPAETVAAAVFTDDTTPTETTTHG